MLYFVIKSYLKLKHKPILKPKTYKELLGRESQIFNPKLFAF